MKEKIKFEEKTKYSPFPANFISWTQNRLNMMNELIISQEKNKITNIPRCCKKITNCTSEIRNTGSTLGEKYSEKIVE